ncbi:MAG TPA: hypothetical protein VHE14_00500 [Solirubrobacteraceae bacterium]|nr:hypothetical protein [Solirubrobacteraceae bacterium]
MSHRTACTALSLGRIAFGSAFLIAPGPAASNWIGADAESAGAQLLCRAVGARDVVLAGGLLNAIRRAAPCRSWIVAGLLADLTDAGATIAAGGGIPRSGRLATVAIAGGAAIAGVVLAGAAD